MDEILMKRLKRVDADVKEGYLTMGNVIKEPLAEGRSVAWIVGACAVLENTAKLLRERIKTFDGIDRADAQAAEMFAKASCVTEAYSYKSEVEGDD